MPRRRSTASDPGALARELHRLYPDADCELDYETPLELLVATILSAQSTDQRVNRITRSLFRSYRTAADYADADPEVLAEEIRSSGFFRSKTERLIGMGKKLVADHGGEVPANMESLVALPGVARKTANVVLGTAFGIADGFVVDTHVKRLAGRLGLSEEEAPEKIEQDLMAAFPRDEWVFLAHALIWHGRRVCSARRPRCDECGLAELCPKVGVEC
ncbi:MAG: endonuclease III [Thermoanaerobaculia bacterium]|nr:endonuclease III [Thermoanaerobaculia bacterium]